MSVLSLGIRKHCLLSGGHERVSSTSGLRPFKITTYVVDFPYHLLS